MNARKKLAIILALIFLLSFIIYAGFEAEKLIYGPQIILSSPKNGGTLEGAGKITVSGLTKNVTFISLDGRQIFTDINGNFNETLVLLPGYNIITLSAKGRYGKEISKKLELYLVKSGENITTASTTATSTQTNFAPQNSNGQAEVSTTTATSTENFATSTQTNFSSKNLNGQAATSTKKL